MSDYPRLDITGLTRLVNGLATKIKSKVDKETGKGLSTNDYTTAEKNKVASIDAIKSEISDMVNIYGSKNLIPYPYQDSSKTSDGITFTDNGDGSITINGTSTAETPFVMVGWSQYRYLPAGTYKIVQPIAYSEKQVFFRMYHYADGTSTIIERLVDFTNQGEVTFTVSEPVMWGMNLIVRANQTLDNLKIYPMIRMASIEDSTWVPYVPTNKALHEEKVSYDDANESVQKNLIPYPFYETTKTVYGITFTDLRDGRIRVNGTATATAVFQIGYPPSNLISLDKNEKYIYTDGNVSNGNEPIYVAGVRYYSEDITIPTTTNGTNVSCKASNNYQVTITGAVSAYCYIYVRSGATVNNVTFSPMLRKTTIKDDTWEPYVPNNKQLVSWKVNGDIGAKNLIPYPYYRPNNWYTQGITYSVSDDGIITMNPGTSVGEADYHMWNRNVRPFHLDKGTYILTGCDMNAPTDRSISLMVNGYNSNGSSVNIANQTSLNPDGVIFTIDDSLKDNFGVLIFCQSGTTVSSALTFKPMIRRIEDTDPTWQPYAMTNREITKEFNIIRDRSASGEDLWQSSHAYAVGDLVIYNNTLYKCVTAHTSGSSFTSSYWSSTTIEAAINRLNRRLWTRLGSMQASSMSSTTFTTMNLDESLENYHLLKLSCSYYSAGLPDYGSTIVPVAEIKFASNEGIIVMQNANEPEYAFLVKYLSPTSLSVRIYKGTPPDQYAWLVVHGIF